MAEKKAELTNNIENQTWYKDTYLFTESLKLQQCPDFPEKNAFNAVKYFMNIYCFDDVMFCNKHQIEWRTFFYKKYFVSAI